MILAKPNQIKIYGHRGARGYLPENTLGSFKYLFKNDISSYETDIVLSKDLVPVIYHDFRLNPDITKDSEGNWITNNDIKIYDLTYEQLSKFTIGSINKKSKYGRRFDNQKDIPEQKIPKLSELLDLTSRNILDGLLINLEIKSTPIENNLTPPPYIMAKLIIDEVNKFKLKDHVIYSSFDWRILREIKTLNSKIPRAYLTSKQRGKIYDKSPWLDLMPVYDKDKLGLPKLIKKLDGNAWHPKHKDIKREDVRISHEEGLLVNVWTVNEEFDMLKMIDYGVDGIITDYPLKLKELCEKKNIKYF
ncbi:glycerophosphodiester phosphodiesterase family protein [Alphaproteobacteria bacterium]|nr:glycerophosphodiester phosphodiesterase family protein [Alphaproteobacteria bacterium]